MARTGRPGLSAEQKRELWSRWKAGQSLSDIGRGLGKHAGSVFGVLAAHGGIMPTPRRRSVLCLGSGEREEISRGLVAGFSFRQIAAQLGRPASTISWEVSRNGYGRKTVMTDTGKLMIEVPRDRQASFDPQLIAKYQRRFRDYQKFRVWAGIMGKKEPQYVTTQRTIDTQ